MLINSSLPLDYKNRILKHQHLRKVKKYASLFFFIIWSMNSISLILWEIKLQTENIYRVNKYKIKSSWNEYVTRRELKFPRTFSKNCEPLRVLLWFAYKITKNICHSQLFCSIRSNSKDLPYLLWQSNYSNLDTTNQAKFF